MDSYIKIWVVLFIWFLSLISAGYILDRQIKEDVQQAEIMIDSGSLVYLDGCQVDPNTIVLEEYKITIRDNIVILND